MGIKKKMANGAFWLFVETGVQQIASFFIFAVLARILGADEYGFVALCGIVLAFINSITTGLADPIISMKIRDNVRLSSLFWLNLLVGIIFSLGSFFFASSFAELFGSDKLQPLLEASSVLPLLYASAAIPSALISATMDFKVFTIRTLFASIGSGVVGLVCALQGWGAYALIAQQVSYHATNNVVVWMSSPWRPRFVFSFNSLRETLRLGMGQSGSSLASFFDNQFPRFVLGYYLGPAAVGYYSFIQRICSALEMGIIQPLLKVIYPALANVSDDHRVRRDIIKESVFVVWAVMSPIVGGIFLTAPTLIPFCFGEKWSPAIDPFRLFSLTLISYSLNTLLLNVLRAQKYIVTYFYAQIVVVFFSMAGCWLMVSWGLNAVVGFKVFASFIMVIVASLLIRHKARIFLGESYRAIYSPIIATLGMVSAVSAFQHISQSNAPTFLYLLTNIVLGGIVYTGIFVLLEKKRTIALFLFFKAYKDRMIKKITGRT